MGIKNYSKKFIKFLKTNKTKIIISFVITLFVIFVIVLISYLVNNIKNNENENKNNDMKNQAKKNINNFKNEIKILEEKFSQHKSITELNNQKNMSIYGPIDNILINNDKNENIKNNNDIKNNNENNQDVVIENYRKLYNLYFNGIPDKYDIFNNRIDGIEPNAEKTIYYLLKIIDNETNLTKKENDILNLARIYHYGMHKYDATNSSRNIAENMYKNIINTTKNKENWISAKEELNNIEKIKAYVWIGRENDIPNNLVRNIGGQWRNNTNNQQLNNQNNIGIIDLNDEIDLNEMDINYDEMDINNYFNQENIFNIPGINIDINTINFNRAILRNIEANRQLKKNNDSPNNIHGNSPQNTHDNVVLKTIKNSANKLKKDFENSDLYNNDDHNSEENVIKELRTFINNMPNNDKKFDAIKSLKIIQSKGTRKLGNTEMSEREALKLVWNRINNEHKGSEDIKNTLVNELADMQQHGMTVCATGRFDRIIDTLNIVDPDVRIVPSKAINEEMLNKAAKIRSDLLESESENERKLLEEGNSNNQSKFEENLRKTILETLEKEYVESNILSKSKFRFEVNKWIDHI